MTAPNLAHELRLARDLALEAGRIIREVYATDFEVQDKGAELGPVTEADRRANEFIVGELRRAFPADGIVAEESKDNSDMKRFRRCWFIDPLDGTREFVNRNGEFAVHVGLALEGEAMLGVVYKPVDDKLYSGIVGEGCVLEHEGQTRRLHVSDVREARDARLLVSRSHKSKRTELVVRELGITQRIESGSVGVKAGLLAEGKADLYLHMSPNSSRWDACAPEAVLRAAGGHFVDLFGSPYRYDTDELLNARGLFACNDALFRAVRATVSRVASEHPPRPPR